MARGAKRDEQQATFECLYRSTDPASSRLAAQALDRSGIAATNRDRVYQGLKGLGPTTYRELAEIVGMEINEVQRRLNDLRREGRVLNGQMRHCTTNGHLMQTWVVVK